MKWIALVMIVILAGCTAKVPLQNETGSYCTPGQNCQLAEENNADLFDTIDNSSLSAEMVRYGEGMKGYLAQPRKEGNYPGVIMIHEWWGLNDNIKTMAHLLAQEGYVVLAVDLYNGSVATTSQEAGVLTTDARQNPNRTIANMRMATSYLRSLENVQDEKIGSMGWCFGGGQSLLLATSGEKLAATVIYYGTLTNDTIKLSKISWPVLGIFGAEDTSIPVSSVNQFDSALDALNISNEIHIYPRVGHAFANPSGARYAANETKDAWKKTVSFLDKNLK